MKESRIAELSTGEIKGLLKYVDRNNRGYVCSSVFMEKLMELTQETKQEQQLRTFALNAKRQGINLK